MSYTRPEQVRSPQDRLQELQVIHDGGEGSWSLARMKWDGENAVGIRWNGNDSSPNGNPLSTGKPIWFILPEEIAGIVVSIILIIKKLPKY